MGSVEVDLNDPLSTDKIPDALRRDGTLNLRLTNTKSTVRYLIDLVTLVFLTEIRNATLQRNKTKRPNTDTGFPPNDFVGENLSRQIAIG